MTGHGFETGRLPRYLQSPLFASHWALFVPNATGHRGDGINSGPGKVNHVEGSVNAGFQLIFKRNYNPLESARGTKLQFLASIDDSFVVNPLDLVTLIIQADPDALPGDQLEQIALSVPAPPKTLGVKASGLLFSASIHFMRQKCDH